VGGGATLSTARPGSDLRGGLPASWPQKRPKNGLLDRSVAQGIVSLKGVRQSGNRAGNWLTREQARSLLARPDIDTIEGKRDRAMLAVLLGCALRRSTALECRHIQPRDGRWVFVDLVGQGKRIRTVPIPPFVKVAIDTCKATARFIGGPLFRRVRRRKYPEKTPEALSERMIWHIVIKYAREAGLVDRLAPHDLRRTCAKLCRASGGDLGQIQFLLGHAAIKTTERYLGSRKNFKEAVNESAGAGLYSLGGQASWRFKPYMGSPHERNIKHAKRGELAFCL
jgi:integrase